MCMPISITNPSLQRCLQKVMPAEKINAADDMQQQEKESIAFLEQLLAPLTLATTKKKKEAVLDADSVSFEELLESNPCKLLHLNYLLKV